jgi:hypothetical protein
MLISGVALVAFAGVLALIMPERGFAPHPRGDRTAWQVARHTVGAGVGLVRALPVLLTIMAVTFFLAMSSETFDQLWEIHFLTYFTFPRLLPIGEEDRAVLPEVG